MDNFYGFKVLVDNRYWNLLQEANQMHVTAQQKYLHLLKDLQDTGVAFKDIRSFLLNEAKKAGLLQKSVWSDKAGEKVYPSKNSLKKARPAWFVQYLNVTAWIARNYETYDRKIDQNKVRQDREQAKAEKKEQKATVVTRNQDGETRTEVVSNEVDMNAPVSEQLSPEQIEQIIMSNLSLFGEYCEDKGAVVEFNALMLKIGKPEVRIEVAEAV